MRRFGSAMVAMAIIGAFFGVTTTAASAKAVINVGPGDSIQDAVNSAKPGDTIVVAPGTYDGGIAVTTDKLTIIGDGAVLQGPSAEDAACRQVGDDDGFCVFSPTFDPKNPVKDVEISGFTIQGFGSIGIVGFAAKGLD